MMPGLPGLMARRGLYEVMTAGARYPWVALPVARWRGHGVPLSADTDIVIEGFPRSGNTFAVAAFAVAQPRPVRIAHHVHAPGHVIEAVRRGIPALVLIRRPEDVVREFVRIRPALTVAQAVRGYVRFYRPLVPHRDRFVVGSFDEVTGRFGSVIRRVNERFGSSFAEFEHTEDNLAKVQPAMDDYWRARTGPGLPLVGRTSAEGSVATADEGRVSSPEASELYRLLAG
jgi:hypothetical protein